MSYMKKNNEKSVKKVENFFANNIFTFNSYECKCEIDKKTLFPGEKPQQIFKAYSVPNSSIRFAFEAKNGLVKLNEDGSVVSRNILGKLLSIKNDRLENYFDFFSKYGFLFPTVENEFTEIKSEILLSIINRLHATLDLLSTVTDIYRTSYEKIVRLIHYLIFNKGIKVTCENQKYCYAEYTTEYYNLFIKAKNLSIPNRQNEKFEKGTYSFNDYIYDKTIDIDSSFIDDIINNNDTSKYSDNNFRNMTFIYATSRENIDDVSLLINDFLFNYYLKVGIISRTTLTETTYVNDECHKENFSSELKEKAIMIAKILIKNEIDNNLFRITPTYNINKMQPAWKIDSLLSALYFGLFYMNPKMEIYRQCASPKCNEFFLVPVTSRKKIYCCKKCQNREMQKKYRANKIGAKN